MPEVGLTQLQMMLVRQGGFGNLPLSSLPTGSFLSFIRTAEQLCLDAKLSPIIVYWSKHSAETLLPDSTRLKQLTEESKCLSVFSEGNLEAADEWCVLIESNKLSLVIYGQEYGPDRTRYKCAGSMDTEVVKQSFASLLPRLQLADPVESNRLEDARASLTYGDSVVSFSQRLKSKWPIVKSPARQDFIITPAEQQAAKQNVTFKTGGEKETVHPPIADGTQPLPEVSQQKPITVDLGRQNLNQTNFKPGGVLADTGGQAVTYSPKTAPSGAAAKPPGLRDEIITSEVKPIVHGLPRQAITAQTIIAEIISRLRHSHNLNAILQFAIEKLAQAVNADRGLIWQVVGDQLAVTHEYSASGNLCFISNRPLHSEESAAIVLEFVNHFPDESAAGVISINDTVQDGNLHKISPTLSSLIELAGVKSRLMVQLRSRGVFFGFLELQQCNASRVWGTDDAMIIQAVAEMLSVVVQQSYDQSKIEVDAREMKLINDIASLFRESRGQSSEQSLVKSVLLVAGHMGFIHAQLYLYHPEDDELVPQIRNGEGEIASVPLSANDNPFVSVFKSGRGKVINAEESKKGDHYFNHDMALILPLSSEGERLGVIGLWQRQSKQLPFRAQDRELGLTIAGHLSNVIRAETAVLQIKAEQARAALINKVSSEIRQSLKEVDQIMATLVESLKEHFNLGRCLVALYDPLAQEFTKYKMSCQPVFNPAGDGQNLVGADKLAPDYIEWQLFHSKLPELRHGNIVFLNQEDLGQIWQGREAGLAGSIKAATLVPLLYGGEFKATLCLLQSEQTRMLPHNDMNMISDVADRVAAVISHAELFAQVERQAVTDPMTGLFNRRYFQEQLTKEIDRYQRFGHPFSLIIADLDLLKKINDTFGHPGGDMAIKHIANVLRLNVRDVDTVGRFGGEEFVVLLPETEQKQARMVAERICAGIRDQTVEGIGTITASLGLATFPNDATEYNKLFELADQSLLLAKRKGRNRVCSASQELMPGLSSQNLPAVTGHSTPALAAEMVTPSPTPVLAASPTAAINLTLVARRGLIGLLSLLAKAIEELDMYEPGRTEDVYTYARKMAERMNLSADRVEMIALAAVYSNLGKLILPKEILKKEGPLTPQEMEIVKSHPSAGARLLETAKLVVRMAPIVEAYQENWDGSGYPLGLKGEEIPVESRIVALVNDFVAMISNRPYRAGLSEEEALHIIESKSGIDYDPQLTELFLSLMGQDVRTAKV